MGYDKWFKNPKYYILVLLYFRYIVVIKHSLLFRVCMIQISQNEEMPTGCNFRMCLEKTLNHVSLYSSVEAGW